MENKKIEVYIDGSSVDVNASVNQQNKRKGLPEIDAEWHGAYAGVFLVDGVEVLRMKGYEKGGTIGKMELSALVQAMIKCLGYSEATIYSDSQYVVNGATKWLKGWKKKNFKDIKFPAMWVQVDMNLHGSCNFGIRWVKGHNGSAGNELADKLANEALGAGITGWKVSGKERFLLFDKVEGFMKSHITGDMLPIHYIQDGTTKTFSVQEEIDVQGMVQSGQMKLSDAMELMREQCDDNDFTDMAKKRVNIDKSVDNPEFRNERNSYVRECKEEIKKSEEEESEDYFQAIADYRKSHPVDYDKEISDCCKAIGNSLARIYELQKQKKEDGTRSTKSNP